MYLGDDKPGVMIGPSSTLVRVTIVPSLKEVLRCVRPRLREINDDEEESNKMEKALQEIHAKTITDYELKYASILLQ